jgi:hypothetical protein
MKSLLLPILFNLLFIDPQTNEKLPGVRVETPNKVYYSNFDGEVSIPGNESVTKISYISYQTIEESHIVGDTIIKLNQIK